MSSDDVEEVSSLSKVLGVVLSIIAAWCFATAAVYSRKLKHIPSKVVMFYHGSIGMIGAGVYWIIEAIIKREIRTYNWKVFAIMLTSCIIDTLAVNAMNLAY